MRALAARKVDLVLLPQRKLFGSDGLLSTEGRGMKLKSTHHQAPIKRVYIPFSQAELNQINSWSFAKHIRDRSEAVRMLVFKNSCIRATCYSRR